MLGCALPLPAKMHVTHPPGFVQSKQAGTSVTSLPKLCIALIANACAFLIPRMIQLCVHVSSTSSIRVLFSRNQFPAVPTTLRTTYMQLSRCCCVSLPMGPPYWIGGSLDELSSVTMRPRLKDLRDRIHRHLFPQHVFLLPFFCCDADRVWHCLPMYGTCGQQLMRRSRHWMQWASVGSPTLRGASKHRRRRRGSGWCHPKERGR